MPCYYNQRTGQFMDFDGTIHRGYSGAEGHINNPASEGLRNLGPTPVGTYRFTELSASKGKNTIHLEPEGHNARGRDSFRIHGDSIRNPGRASKGCIILNGADLRERLYNNPGKTLIVVDEPEWE